MFPYTSTASSFDDETRGSAARGILTQPRAAACRPVRTADSPAPGDVAPGRHPRLGGSLRALLDRAAHERRFERFQRAPPTTVSAPDFDWRLPPKLAKLEVSVPPQSPISVVPHSRATTGSGTSRSVDSAAEAGDEVRGLSGPHREADTTRPPSVSEAYRSRRQH